MITKLTFSVSLLYIRMDSLVLAALSVRLQLMEGSPLTLVRQNRHVTFFRSRQRGKNPSSHLW